MKLQHFSKRTVLLIAFLLMTFVLQTAVAQTNQPAQFTSAAATEILLIAAYTDNPPDPVLAPAAARQPNGVQTADIQVNYIDKATTWDLQPGAEAAFQYAVDIWASLVESNTTIVIDAHWTPLPEGVLGAAGANGYYANGPGLPQVNTFYPVPLVNTLAGYDVNGGDVEIVAYFNSTFSTLSGWYFGTGSNTPSDQWNFATVVLHEIGHGLGFSGSMNVSGGVGSWGLGTNAYPIIYDRFTENGAGTSLFSFGNNTVALGNQLTSNNIYFDGPASKAANGNSVVELYAPSTWQGGSSYSHLGESFNGTDHALMTWSLTNGETNYNPGSVTLGILADIGWTMVTPPELLPLPTQLMETNTALNPAFDLHNYTDPGSGDIGDLTYILTDAGAAEAGITLTGNRYINVNPNTGWNGSTTATVQVSHPSNGTDSGEFSVVVTDTIYNTFLPLVLK